MVERLYHVQTVRLPDHRFDTIVSVFTDPFTTGETAKALNVDVGTVWWLIKEGRCPVLREGRKVRIPVWWIETGNQGYN
jgi:excisionase family DNA binding protein